MANPDNPPSPLSAKHKNSFAYTTIKDRIPVIVSKVADYLHRNREALNQKFSGPESEEELKTIIGAMSCLRHEVMTNKPAMPLKDMGADVIAWNQDLQRQTELNGGEAPSWFNSPWLWMECYLYRRMQEAVLLSPCFRSLDMFGEQKQNAFHGSYSSISLLAMHLVGINRCQEKSTEDINKYFKDFLQMALWGNKCDLSISAGEDNNQTENPFDQLSSLNPYILMDDSDAILQLLRERQHKLNGTGAKISIVLDNAGYEFMTDLCLADYLISSGLASCIVFHGKFMPWFVSDVTKSDVEWLFKELQCMNHLGISHLSQTWQRYRQNGTMTFEYDPFWTMSYSFNEMKTLHPGLYTKLSQSDLMIFKGDLNYRKLVGDLNWDPTSGFSHSLRGFHPTALCSLRTLKSDVVVGLKPGQAQEVEAQDPDWMTKGKWAVISLHKQ